jgi:hypothetical protein
MDNNDFNNFKIKMYHYIKGELQIIIEEFECFEKAIDRGLKALCHSFKIFDRDGCVCHDSHAHCRDTYCDDSYGNPHC